MNEKSKVDQLTKGLYAGGMASTLALFGLSVFGFRQRMKRNRITLKTRGNLQARNRTQKERTDQSNITFSTKEYLYSTTQGKLGEHQKIYRIVQNGIQANGDALKERKCFR